ncbi:MAG: hypothetical protein MZV64_51785 [Ignavibacteriales bacterium]|nr:hypothetical protein [Ignavibacteriales bacterium]
MVFKRELYTGLALGLALGCNRIFKNAPFGRLLRHIYGEHWFLIGVTVSISLIGVVLWGTLSGSMLPFILKRFGCRSCNFICPLSCYNG